MANLSLSWNRVPAPPSLPLQSLRALDPDGGADQRKQKLKASAPRAGGFSVNSILKRCQKCGGKGAIECPGCKGTGKNKKNGNIFERWKCFDCQGFGLKSCPSCGQGGLTPEQRGER